MAHLEVQPKESRPWWMWLLLALVAIALAALLFNKCNSEKTAIGPDTTVNNTGSASMAATVPDWKSVNFNSETTTDADITDRDISTRGNETYTIYTLGENILFPTDGSVVSKAGEAKLKMISDVLNKRFDGATVGVFGSTDATGGENLNKELGRERAESVKNWLAASGKVASETISVQSLGETEPVATNQTEAGRQQNRNVSIVVFPKK